MAVFTDPANFTYFNYHHVTLILPKRKHAFRFVVIFYLNLAFVSAKSRCLLSQLVFVA